MRYRNRRGVRHNPAIRYRDPQAEMVRLETRIEALRMARPHFEALNKAVLTAENEIIKARQNLIATQQKRGWLTKLFIAFGTDEEAKRFDLHKNSYVQPLDRLERELIEICPKAYSKPKPRPFRLGIRVWRHGRAEACKRRRTKISALRYPC